MNKKAVAALVAVTTGLSGLVLALTVGAGAASASPAAKPTPTPSPSPTVTVPPPPERLRMVSHDMVIAGTCCGGSNNVVWTPVIPAGYEVSDYWIEQVQTANGNPNNYDDTRLIVRQLRGDRVTVPFGNTPSVTTPFSVEYDQLGSYDMILRVHLTETYVGDEVSE